MEKSSAPRLPIGTWIRADPIKVHPRLMNGSESPVIDNVIAQRSIMPPGWGHRTGIFTKRRGFREIFARNDRRYRDSDVSDGSCLACRHRGYGVPEPVRTRAGGCDTVSG